MAGSFDVDNTRPPLYGDAVPIFVARYDPNATGDPYAIMPNVRCLRIDQREGAEPPVARLEYILDDTLAINLGWPSQFEELWPLTARGEYVVNADDRIVVLAMDPDESLVILFDGFAQVPQADVTPAAQRVTFAAVGVATRAWDDPISGRVQRGADPKTIDDQSGDGDVQVDLPTHFNPGNHEIGSRGGYLPNASPEGKDTKVPDKSFDHPVFLESALKRDPDPRQYWTVPMAVKYILAEYNADETYVKNPTFSRLDDELVAKFPHEGEATFDPHDCETAPVTIRDYDASNKAWPEAVAELLGYAGFGMRWDVSVDSVDKPVTKLEAYRKDAAATIIPKRVFLDRLRPEYLDPSKNNVTQLHLARDANQLVNAWQVETRQRQVEVSIILVPLYQPDTADKTTSVRKQFLKSALIDPNVSAVVRRKYRWYGADECGDGHWDGSDWKTGPFDFSRIFLPDEDESPSYTIRYRPGSNTIVAKDSLGHPRKAELAISFDYEGDIQAVWDGTGTWHTLKSGNNWQLLKDRLGIEVTANDLSTWSVGKSAVSVKDGVVGTSKIPSGRINGITWWADPPAGKPTFGKMPKFRLTTMIEDDLRMPISIPKRMASPTKFARWKSVDGRDHFQYAAVDPSSSNFTAVGGSGEEPFVVRDDTAKAFAHAHQLRSAHEFPSLSGSVVIPYHTRYYRVGDRLREIDGRDVDLSVNVGRDQGETASYPWIVAIAFDFDGDRQSTTLQLSDRRAERPNI